MLADLITFVTKKSMLVCHENHNFLKKGTLCSFMSLKEKKVYMKVRARVTALPKNNCQNLVCKHGFEFYSTRLFPILNNI